MKKEILQRRVVRVKSKHVPKVSREINIHYVSTTKALLQTFGGTKHFVPKKSEGQSDSTR